MVVLVTSKQVSHLAIAFCISWSQWNAHTHIDYYIHSTNFIYNIAGNMHRCNSWKCCVCIRRNFHSFCFCVRRMLQLIMPSCVTPLCFTHSRNFWETFNLVANIPLTWHSFAKKSSPATLCMYPCRVDSLSPPPTENDKADLLYLFFVLMQDRSILRRVAELARDKDLLNVLQFWYT